MQERKKWKTFRVRGGAACDIINFISFVPPSSLPLLLLLGVISLDRDGTYAVLRAVL